MGMGTGHGQIVCLPVTKPGNGVPFTITAPSSTASAKETGSGAGARAVVGELSSSPTARIATRRDCGRAPSASAEVERWRWADADADGG